MVALIEHELDAVATRKFADRMVDCLDDAALTTLTFVGRAAGLFDVMAEMESASADDIADEAGLDPLAVREWLNAMFVGEVIEYDFRIDRYWLPPERAACLAREVEPDVAACVAAPLNRLAAAEACAKRLVKATKCGRCSRCRAAAIDMPAWCGHA